MKKRVLFLSENVTMSQVVRLLVLARSLDPERYEVHFACAAFDEDLFRGTSFIRHRVHSPSPGAVLAAARSGRRLYDHGTLRRQVQEDLGLFEAIQPDLVVGDFRWSLAISAKVAGVPHAALTNAYWSPFAADQSCPAPDHPIVRLLGETVASRYYPVAAPYVFAHFARPVNDVRREYGLPPVGSLREVLTEGDFVLHADPPELVPVVGSPPTHEFIGHVAWAPDVALPAFWGDLPTDRPIVYASAGSSGTADLLPVVLEALGGLEVTGIVATLGRLGTHRVPPNVRVADFLPGDVAARRSALVVTNGGSGSAYQALAEGVPVVGIASNLDQYLAMTAIEKSGAGKLVRAGTITVEGLRAAMTEVLGSDAHREAARRAREHVRRLSATVAFAGFLERVFAAPRPAPSRVVQPVVRPRSRALGLFSVSALLGVMALGSDAGADGARQPAPVTNEIRFITSVDGNQGHVICALFRESGWLKSPVQSRKAAIRGREATCVFTGVEPGTYGVVSFHDENDSGNIDTNFLGIPTEDWCTSRNARAFMGPPSFGDAKFLYRSRSISLQCKT
jgi:UDP:flavonoid glycosyltransferase YjiC (YdhE family)/uncharacterized protein (DUF2141 family)